MKDSDPNHYPAFDNYENSQDLANNLEERIIDFAVRIIKLCSALPKTPAGIHIAGQMLRAGTSPAPTMVKQEGPRAELTSCIKSEWFPKS